MARYVIADVRVTDEAGFADFAAGVPASIERHGGGYIIRGGDIDVRQGRLGAASLRRGGVRFNVGGSQGLARLG